MKDNQFANDVLIIRCSQCDTSLVTTCSGGLWEAFARSYASKLCCGSCRKFAPAQRDEVFGHAPPAPRNPLHILLADDDDDVSKLLALFLRKQGHEVSMVSDGISLLQTAKANNFDLIISDVRMPNGYGDEIFSILQDAGIHLPMILISGFPETVLLDAAVMVLAKPIELDVLADAVQFTNGRAQPDAPPA